jgi:hypothetical protein
MEKDLRDQVVETGTDLQDQVKVMGLQDQVKVMKMDLQGQEMDLIMGDHLVEEDQILEEPREVMNHGIMVKVLQMEVMNLIGQGVQEVMNTLFKVNEIEN